MHIFVRAAAVNGTFSTLYSQTLWEMFQSQPTCTGPLAQVLERHRYEKCCISTHISIIIELYIALLAAFCKRLEYGNSHLIQRYIHSCAMMAGSSPVDAADPVKPADGDDVINLYNLSRNFVRNIIPCGSPAGLKLETWLRLKKLPYKVSVGCVCIIHLGLMFY